MKSRGPLWEVTGGEATGGIIVRGGKALNSPILPERLIIGSLVQQLRLEDGRLYYWKVAGHGPVYGWVSVAVHGEELLSRTEKMPWDYVPSQRALNAIQDAKTALSMPKILEVKGVFTHYHQVKFADSKPTGLRLSGCLVAMDELRTEMCQEADTTVASFENVVDHIVEMAVELQPAVTCLSGQEDGLLYTTRDAKGPILSWLRVESQLGWPSFPYKAEEHTVFLVGKDKFGPARSTPIATARFMQAFCDNSEKTVPLDGEQWRQDFDKFWATPRGRYSSGRLAETRLSELYPVGGNKFSPTQFQKISIQLTHCFQDLWGSLNHAKVPELLWDINMRAGVGFANLLEKDADPQALAAKMPKSMSIGRFYDVYCFVENGKRRAVYIVVPEGEKQASSCVLAVCARYNWESVLPQGKTLTKEDLSMIDSDGQTAFLDYAINHSHQKPDSLCDFSALP
jgi:hypothetical protein